MLNATLLERVEVSETGVIMKVLPDAGVPDFLPGQYVSLGLSEDDSRPEGFQSSPQASAASKLIKRAYSVGSSPQNREHLEFYVALAPDGELTSRLFTLPQGGRIFVGPRVAGSFTLSDVPHDHNLILVATGTGIAAFMSMLRTASTWTPGRSVTLIHGVRYSVDLAYQHELTTLMLDKEGFFYYPLVSRIDPEWKGQRGRVDRLFVEGLIRPNTNHDHIFLCGNPGMVDGMQALLEGQGFARHTRHSPGNLHLEKYW